MWQWVPHTLKMHWAQKSCTCFSPESAAEQVHWMALSPAPQKNFLVLWEKEERLFKKTWSLDLNLQGGGGGIILNLHRAYSPYGGHDDSDEWAVRWQGQLWGQWLDAVWGKAHCAWTTVCHSWVGWILLSSQMTSWGQRSLPRRWGTVGGWGWISQERVCSRQSSPGRTWLTGSALVVPITTSIWDQPHQPCLPMALHLRA